MAHKHGGKILGQILLRLPQPIDRPLDPLADCPPVEPLLPAEPLERDAPPRESVVFPRQTDGKRMVKEWRAARSSQPIAGRK